MKKERERERERERDADCIWEGEPKETRGLRKHGSLMRLGRGSMNCLLKSRYFKWMAQIKKIVDEQFL
jgi:hypothetical protein